MWRRPAQFRKLSLFWIAFNNNWTTQNLSKSKTWRGRKILGGGDLILRAFLPRILFRFFFANTIKKKSLNSTKLNVRNVKAPACVSPRFQDPPLNPCNTVQWYVNVDYYCYVSFSNVTTLYFSHYWPALHRLVEREYNYDKWTRLLSDIRLFMFFFLSVGTHPALNSTAPLLAMDYIWNVWNNNSIGGYTCNAFGAI